MTIFDAIALAIVGWSAFTGFNRGVVAEVIGLFALAISALATLTLLPFVAPMVRHVLHAGWLSAVVAAVGVFAVVFLFLRLLAATLSSSVNSSFLGGANRLGGLVFGALRGIVFLGLVALIFGRVTPEALRPAWITNAAAYPAAGAVGRAMQAMAPKRFDWASGFGGALSNAVGEQSRRPDEDASPSETAPNETAPISAGEPAADQTENPPASERVKRHEHAYTRRARDSVDALVERSR